MSSKHEANKRWRINNPEKWAAQKQRNYARGKPATAKLRRPWSEGEDELITRLHRPEDRELAQSLNRSVQSIQARRSKLLGKR
ncbi:MAG: hypothetical protein KIH67_002775 [Candidatus Moranbacteria bacterium]|nr:hypothetical protein [Candidatus Moranbacteria bacterium]